MGADLIIEAIFEAAASRGIPATAALELYAFISLEGLHTSPKPSMKEVRSTP